MLPLPQHFYKSLKLSRKFFFHATIFIYPNEIGKIFKIMSRQNKKHSKVVFMCVSEWDTEEAGKALWWLRYSTRRQKKKKKDTPLVGSGTALPFCFLPNRHLWCILESLPLCKWSNINWSADTSLVCYTPKKVPYPVIYKVHLSLTLLLLETRANAEGETIIDPRLENKKSGNGAGGRGY